jgi:hypothetical protein
MNFLQRDELYQTEKPYLCLFETPAGFSKTNIQLSKCKDLIIIDIRGRESRFLLGSHGFAIMHMTSKLSYDDFGDNAKVKSQYLSEVAEHLRRFCKASRVQIFEHVVSIYYFSYIRLLLVVDINCYDVQKLLPATDYGPETLRFENATRFSQYLLASPTITTSQRQLRT